MTESTQLTTIGQNAMTTQAAMTQAVSLREAQEVQGQILMAKNFPRDTSMSLNRILDSCKRRALAEQAMYAYQRGGALVTGPSIRLAEMMAQNWGNLDYGMRVLDNDKDEATVEAYCWDMETNVRQRRVFPVKHVRHTKKGPYPLTDPRDQYENIANQGARRLRACILGIIPGDVQEQAVTKCEETMANVQGMTREQQIEKMVYAFHEMGVEKHHIENRIGHNIKSITNTEIVQLKKIWKSIDDDMSTPEQWFDMEDDKPTPPPGGKGGKKSKTSAKPPATEDQTSADAQQSAPVATQTKAQATRQPGDVFGDDDDVVGELVDQMTALVHRKLEAGFAPDYLKSILGESPSEIARRDTGTIQAAIEALSDLPLKPETIGQEDPPKPAKRKQGRPKKDAAPPPAADPEPEGMPDDELPAANEDGIWTDVKRPGVDAYETIDKLLYQNGGRDGGVIQSYLVRLANSELRMGDGALIAKAYRWAKNGKIDELRDLTTQRELLKT